MFCFSSSCLDSGELESNDLEDVISIPGSTQSIHHIL